MGLWDIYPGGRGVGGPPPKYLISLVLLMLYVSHL